MTEQPFDLVLTSAGRYRQYGLPLRTLLRDVYEHGRANPTDLAALKNALEALLEYLASPEGRTDANCCTVDAFFAKIGDEWQHLPRAFRDVLDRLSGTLHDTIYAEHIARNFESTPEQLLEKARRL